MRRSSYMIRGSRNQLSATQMCEPRVDGAFGESCCVGDCAHTGANAAPFISRGLAVKVQVNNKRGGLLMVPDQIAHYHIQDVIVDRNGAFETRHRERRKDEGRS